MYRKFLKRFFDIICALAVFLFLWPVFIVVAVLVKIKLGGPIIFKQLRPGKDGRMFYIYKFRTMKIQKDAHGNDFPDSERMTKFGERLRRTSLDEIPEAWNILKGDMSVIGPRPLLVKDYVFFSDEIKHRQDVRPGLSGLAQVNGRNSISWEKKFEYDLEYVKKITFWKDFKIVMKSIYQAFFKRNKEINKDGFVTDENYGDYLLRTRKITQEEYKMTIVDSYLIIGLRENKDAWPNH